MSARIRSLQNGINAVDEASRDDLVLTDVVTVSSLDAHTTYGWTIAFAPEGSSAAFSGDVTAVSPGTFTVDVEGPYLIRLTVDVGLGTEDTQYVRLRALTTFGGLKLVAAGERRDSTGVIPVDVDTEGWANEQNFNHNTLLAFVKSVASSGRILYVDANAGSAQGYADHDTVQAAIDAAETAGATLSDPYIVAIRPGLYTEDLTFKAHIHVCAWPGNDSGQDDQYVVELRGEHTMDLPNAGDRCVLSHLTLTNPTTAASTPLIEQGGTELGTAYIYRCHLNVSGLDAAQGPCYSLDGGSAIFVGSRLEHTSSGAATRLAFEQDGAATTSEFRDCILDGPSGADINLSRNATVNAGFFNCRIISRGTGATGIQSSAEQLLLEWCRVEIEGTGTPLSIHPSGAAVPGDVRGRVRWTYLDGDIDIDDTNVAGTGALHLGSVIYSGTVNQTGSPTIAATVNSDTLFYDNTTTSMTAENVQAALDELHGLATLVTTLDDAYDGGVPASGGGRTIIADQGAVQIVDAASPSNPPPAANANGNLEVVGKVSVGAITLPEVDIDPNPYGSGPRIKGGWAVVPTDQAFGAGNFWVVANSTGTALFRNYNQRLGTLSTDGGGTIGRTIIRGGDSLDQLATQAGEVYVQAGDAHDAAGGAPGAVWISPGYGANGPTSAVAHLVNPAASTAATLEANAAAADPIGVTGDIIFGTNMGAVTLSVAAAETRATVVSNLNALDGVTAAEAAGVITITTQSKGPNAEIHLLSADAGVNAAMGDFSIGGGATFTAGTYAEYVDLACSADQELTIGNGTNDLVYNALTGKLTVPGLIDPTGMIFTEASRPSTGATEGAIYVSDGSNGETQNSLYYRAANDAVGVAISGVASSLSWKDGVSLIRYIGTRTITQINALSPTGGLVVVAGDGGTPSAGTSDVLAAGDIAEYDGSSWKRLITNSGGFPPNGTRLLVHPETVTLFSPLTDGADEGKFAIFDGTSLTPATLETPVDGDATLVHGDASVNAHKQYVYNGTAPSGSWVQFGGLGMDHGVLAGLGDDDHSQYALLTGRSGGQVYQGGTDANDDLELESTTNAAKGRILARDPVAYDEAGRPTTNANEGATYVSDGTNSEVQGELYYRRASNGLHVNVSTNLLPYHMNFDEVPNNTVEYRGWVPTGCRCVAIRVYMGTVNTVGAYDLTVTNEGTTNTMLNSSPYDMNGLSNDTVTVVPLTATSNDLLFSAGGRWTVSLTSDNAGFNGGNIYVELVFEVI